MISSSRRSVGFIHESCNYWINTLNCDDYVLCILQEGYKVAFVSHPPLECYEKNNLSSLNSTAFVEAEITSLLDKGLIMESSMRTIYCSPFTVVHGKKDRLVLNLSHCINKHVKSPHFKIDDLKSSEVGTRNFFLSPQFAFPQFFLHFHYHNSVNFPNFPSPLSLICYC